MANGREKLTRERTSFHLSIVFYEMLSGRRPFDGNSAIETMHAIIIREPKPVAELNPTLPPEVSDILEKALAKTRLIATEMQMIFELDLAPLQTRASNPIRSSVCDSQEELHTNKLSLGSRM
jgi:serine/threonine protein kinase